MTDNALLLQTLARIEGKVDKLAEEVAELRGAKKAAFAIAAIVGTLVSFVIGYFRSRP